MPAAAVTGAGTELLDVASPVLTLHHTPPPHDDPAPVDSPQAYAAWLGRNLPTSNLAEPSRTDPRTGLDSDGLGNLFDYAIDGNPLGGDPVLRPALTVVDENRQRAPRFRVGRDPPLPATSASSAI